jgi:hypothetical protein
VNTSLFLNLIKHTYTLNSKVMSLNVNKYDDYECSVGCEKQLTGISLIWK